MSQWVVNIFVWDEGWADWSVAITSPMVPTALPSHKTPGWSALDAICVFLRFLFSFPRRELLTFSGRGEGWSCLSQSGYFYTPSSTLWWVLFCSCSQVCLSPMFTSSDGPERRRGKKAGGRKWWKWSVGNQNGWCGQNVKTWTEWSQNGDTVNSMDVMISAVSTCTMNHAVQHGSCCPACRIFTQFMSGQAWTSVIHAWSWWPSMVHCDPQWSMLDRLKIAYPHGISHFCPILCIMIEAITDP